MKMILIGRTLINPNNVDTVDVYAGAPRLFIHGRPHLLDGVSIDEVVTALGLDVPEEWLTEARSRERIPPKAA